MPVVTEAGTALHYDSSGDGDPVVFVHGGWVSSWMWTPQVDRFASSHEVITVDVRGHGRTGPTPRGRYTVDLFVADLRKVLERLDVHDPIICGLSLGGLVAQGYAAAYPDDVSGLVLAATTQTIPPIPLSRLQKLVLAPKPLIHATIRTMGVRAYYESLLSAIRSVEGHRWVALSPAVRTYVRTEIDQFDRGEYIKVFDALYDYRPTDVSRLDHPAVVVHGSHEAASVIHQNRTLADDLNAERHVLPDAGHLANLDNPPAFNAVLSDFLSA